MRVGFKRLDQPKRLLWQIEEFEEVFTATSSLILEVYDSQNQISSCFSKRVKRIPGWIFPAENM